MEKERNMLPYARSLGCNDVLKTLEGITLLLLLLHVFVVKGKFDGYELGSGAASTTLI